MSDWRWFVYIIECKDGLYYTGMTRNLAKSFEQHLFGNGSKFTHKHVANKFVYYEEFNNIDDARKRELRIKDWSRKKKKKLINVELCF